jgi:hypothetical protein
MTGNYHIQKVFTASEPKMGSVIRSFRITAATDRKILSDAGKVTAEIAQAHAESEFEKYRLVQDCHFLSDFNAGVKKLATGSSANKTKKDA